MIIEVNEKIITVEEEIEEESCMVELVWVWLPDKYSFEENYIPTREN